MCSIDVFMINLSKNFLRMSNTDLVQHPRLVTQASQVSSIIRIAHRGFFENLFRLKRRHEVDSGPDILTIIHHTT